MKRWIMPSLLVLSLVLVAAVLGPPVKPQIGQAAPDFSLVSAMDDQTVSLSDYRGSYVVLEWLSFECPYVQKHYGSSNMQSLQERYTDAGVVWLSIVTGEPESAAKQIVEKNKQAGGRQTAILLDPDGEVGRLYGAQTTPHMFVIDPEGTLRYMGGIDDKPSTDRSDIETASNYVSTALDQAMAGEEVAVATAPPYGCNVKYPN